MTVADVLAGALQLPPLAAQPMIFPCLRYDAVFGQPIRQGYAVADVATGATAEFLDQFRGSPDGWVAEATARCYRSKATDDKAPLGRIALATVAFTDGTLWHPVIGLASATAVRPAWRDLVRALWPARAGQQCVMILTTDPKKRLWPRAQLGALGERTPVLVHDGETCVSETLWVDWQQLLAALDVVEEAYCAGFAKPAMRESLWLGRHAVQQNGIPATRRLEERLAVWRSRSEFVMAVLIAQKEL